LLKLFWRHHSRIEVETILSGSGLAKLYWANSVLQDKEATKEPEAVTAGARSGDQLCRQAITDFMDILAAVASDAAMILGAVDGVYICGGIVPRLKGLYDPQRFRERFNDKGPYRDFCSRIPLALVEAENTGLRGCWRAMSLRNPHV
jgi:glucokinase